MDNENSIKHCRLLVNNEPLVVIDINSSKFDVGNIKFLKAVLRKCEELEIDFKYYCLSLDNKYCYDIYTREYTNE